MDQQKITHNTIPIDYSNDNIVEDNIESDIDQKKFSPQSAIERLKSLPNTVVEAFANIDVMLNILIDELYNRCNNNDPLTIDTMWHKIVLSSCKSFRRKHYPRRNDIAPVGQDVINYFKSTSIINLLQTFNDIAQRNGFEANEKNDKNAYHYKNMYHEFVRLFHQCSDPQKLNRKKQNRGPIQNQLTNQYPQQVNQKSVYQRGAYRQTNNNNNDNDNYNSIQQNRSKQYDNQNRSFNNQHRIDMRQDDNNTNSQNTSQFNNQNRTYIRKNDNTTNSQNKYNASSSGGFMEYSNRFPVLPTIKKRPPQ